MSTLLLDQIEEIKKQITKLEKEITKLKSDINKKTQIHYSEKKELLSNLDRYKNIPELRKQAESMERTIENLIVYI